MKTAGNEALADGISSAKTTGGSLGATSVLCRGSAALPGECCAQTVKGAQRREPGAAPGRRRLGKLEVSAVGMGVQNMHRKYETTVPYRPEMINILRAAYDRGITFFDTAEAYGPFENERILGEAIRAVSEQGQDHVEVRLEHRSADGPAASRAQQQTGSYQAGRSKASLKRLRTDRIDLLYQHRVDPEVPIEDVAGAVKDLMDQGKVLHWGLSEPGVKTIRRAHATLPANRHSERVLDGDARPGKGSDTTLRGVGDRLRPLVATRTANCLPAGSMRTRDSLPAISVPPLRDSRRRTWLTTCSLVELIKTWADRKQATPGSDRARLADGAEALDRADSRNDRDAAHAGEQRRGRGSIYSRRTH